MIVWYYVSRMREGGGIVKCAVLKTLAILIVVQLCTGFFSRHDNYGNCGLALIFNVDPDFSSLLKNNKRAH